MPTFLPQIVQKIQTYLILKDLLELHTFEDFLRKDFPLKDFLGNDTSILTDSLLKDIQQRVQVGLVQMEQTPTKRVCDAISRRNQSINIDNDVDPMIRVIPHRLRKLLIQKMSSLHNVRSTLALMRRLGTIRRWIKCGCGFVVCTRSNIGSNIF